MVKVNYNERSWAIDVISEINLFLSNKSWHFKSAGGENTISNDKKSLFPDVLIFKDKSREIILQGWELKMPDTAINDAALISNAIQKAIILQRDSFVLWNARSAVLYLKKGDSFSILKSWDEIEIKSRTEVKSKQNLWKTLLHTILEDLNHYFETGYISDTASAEILGIDTIIDVILENIPSTVDKLKNKTRTHAKLEAQINNWWLSSASEYGFDPTAPKELLNKWPTLSKVILTDWVFKIIFANVLKRHFNEARAIEKIDTNTSIKQAKEIISAISEHCNFWNIFSNNLAIEHISDNAWRQITQLNQFLATINIDGIELEILHNLLQSSIASAKRKVAGQYASPKNLADLLVRLTLENKEGIVIDPCCGTGTIINQAYLLKEEYELNQKEIIDSIWASDKQSFPIQLSTLTLAKPDNIRKVLNIFRNDVIDLKIGQEIQFKDPNNGSNIIKNLPIIDYAVSNLPFIKNKEIEVLNPKIFDVNDFIRDEANTTRILSGKSDIFAYIPFYLHPLLSENGKIGLILSNAWMGTDYGEIFVELFQNFYDIESVIISGKGKWFNNAKVVTTLLIANKRNPSKPIDQNRTISFFTLNEKIDSVQNIKQLSENILLKVESNELAIETYSINQIKTFESIGTPWSAFFSNLNWLNSVKSKLTDANNIFSFSRGERRGQNALFYPKAGHTIEEIYLAPLLKDLRATKGLKSVPNKVAFCCSKSLDELESLGHTGALNWINSFENQTNGKGVLLHKALAKSGMYWYEMKPKKQGDFVANVNYHNSLFISQVEGDIFIDQRMIVFTIKKEFKNEDEILMLAMLNSIMSMFFIESYGFGRGEGVLDLRATKFKRDFKIFNFQLLNSEQKANIVTAFYPISQRTRLPFEQEIEQEDRMNFECLLFGYFGVDKYYEAIKSALLHLYKIRFAVKI